MKTLYLRMAQAWCKAMHRAPRWPIHGEYECPECFRRYPVPWANSFTAHSSRISEPQQYSGEMILEHANS